MGRGDAEAWCAVPYVDEDGGGHRLGLAENLDGLDGGCGCGCEIGHNIGLRAAIKHPPSTGTK